MKPSRLLTKTQQFDNTTKDIYLLYYDAYGPHFCSKLASKASDHRKCEDTLRVANVPRGTIGNDAYKVHCAFLDGYERKGTHIIEGINYYQQS